MGPAAPAASVSITAEGSAPTHRALIESWYALMAMPEEEIDISDIPEVRELPPEAVRGNFFPRTVALNEDLHTYFSAIAARKGMSLNDLINDILAKDMAIVETMS